ncbi:MAG: ABC transporter substrate-binding protein [Acidimicrobiales bacterium]
MISDFQGTLADKRVRQALSMALDRQGLTNALYKGAAVPARSLAVPGTWGYAEDAFAQAWDDLPDVSTPDIEAAKALIEEAGATGQTVRIGMSSEIGALALSAGELQRAAESIGLTAELVSVSAANYINFFIDEAARADVDGFFTVNYPDYADPLAILSTLIGPNGSQAYNGYADPAAIDLAGRAQATADDAERAKLVIELQSMIMDEMLWIPIVAPTNCS